MALKAKELRYAVAQTAAGVLTREDGAGLEVPAGWSPEHLLLAAVIRCSLESLGHHARRAGFEVRSSSGSGRALVTRRETDGRYAVVEADVELAAEIEPEPDSTALAELLALAERDCFVGASLTAEPRYRWTVNGRVVGS